MTAEAEAGDAGAGNAQGHQEPEEAGRTLPQSLQRERQNLDFGLLAPRTVGEQGFVILSPQSVEICYGGHRKLTRVASWDLGSDAGAVDIFLYIRPGCFSLHKPVPVPPAWDAKPGFGVPS